MLITSLIGTNIYRAKTHSGLTLIQGVALAVHIALPEAAMGISQTLKLKLLIQRKLLASSSLASPIEMINLELLQNILEGKCHFILVE